MFLATPREPVRRSFLQARECDEAQGYHFSRPVPAEEFSTLLRSGIPLPIIGPVA